jgi:outer membrane protein assembly factor BamE
VHLLPKYDLYVNKGAIMVHCNAFQTKEKNIVCLHFLVLHENIRYDYDQKNNLTIEKIRNPMLHTLRLITLLTATVLLSACSTLAVDIPLVYKIDIDQGNVINQDMINQLRPNMTKRQVIYVLGSPLLTDPFTRNRWDYIYSVQPGGEDRLQDRIALYFAGDSLIHVEGNLTPDLNPAPPAPTEMTIEAPKRDLRRTLYQMIVDLFTFDEG